MFSSSIFNSSLILSNKNLNFLKITTHVLFATKSKLVVLKNI